MSAPRDAAWRTSTGHARTSTYAWQKLREKVLRRDDRRCYLCQGEGADAVDHIVPAYRGGTDDLENLAAVHDAVAPHCHRKKTAQEAHAARQAKRKRPAPQHPGLIA